MLLNTMETHLTVKTEGYRSSTDPTFHLLLKAVAEGSSLEAVCADSCGIVSSNTLRQQLNTTLDVGQLRQQEAQMNRALQAAIKGQRRAAYQASSTNVMMVSLTKTA
jgi:outer membrane murein-binding lipoprotein Lpp